MSNFKLKHQSKAPLLNRHKGKHYIYEPPMPIQPRFEKFKYVEPTKIERPAPVEYIPSVRNELMPELPRVENFRPILEDPNKFRNLEHMRLLEESNRMRENLVQTQRAKNAEKNRIKYEKQENKRKQDEARKQMMEQLKKEKPLFIPEYKVQEYDATTGRPYDDSEAGRAERLAREQEAGMRDEMGYQTSNYEGGVALMKRNSATPYKLPHQSNSAFRYGHNDPPPFAPANYDEVPSFQETFANSSGGDNNDDQELNKFLEGIHQIDNPEYIDPDNPEYEAPRSTEHDFFIKNRSKESDSIAKVFMNLDKDARRLRSERNFKAAGEKQNEINNLLKYIKQQNENRIQE